jgi:hypothetical protein
VLDGDRICFVGLLLLFAVRVYIDTSRVASYFKKPKFQQIVLTCMQILDGEVAKVADMLDWTHPWSMIFDFKPV